MESSSRTEVEKTPFNPLPQNAPGTSAAIGHRLENSIPLSIFPIATDKFCICFCGLPGRGKTHISRRLGRYLQFFHAMPVSIYSMSDYRRERFGAISEAQWYDPHNQAANEMRDTCLKDIMSDMFKFLQENASGVAIFDATNPTHERRRDVHRQVRAIGAKLLWIEVMCEDESFLLKQYHNIATTSPDYAGIQNADAVTQYRNRVDQYKGFFEPLDKGACAKEEGRWSYLKCDHSRQHFVVHNVKGYLMQKVVNFIMNLRTTRHAFYLSRHGQSEYNNLGRIGGDSGLSEHGVRYAEKLAQFVEDAVTKDADGNELPARLWTSTMRRTKETTQFIKQKTLIVKPDPADPSQDFEWVQMRPRAWHHLDELFAGSCDGMTYEEIEEKFPDEWKLRAADKLAYRYPRGESYLDVIARLEPIIIEMERHQEPLLIVAHQGILRIIYAFYMGLSRADAPYVTIKLNCVTELKPGVYGCSEKVHQLYKPDKSLGHDGQKEKQGAASVPLSQDDDPPSH